MEEFTYLYERIQRALLSALKDEAEQLWQLFQVLVMKNMIAARRAIGERAGDKLSKGRGGLARALINGKTGNIFKKTISVLGGDFEYGIDADLIKYAEIHEYGGTIPITVRMRKFFWAMYKKTKAEFWRAMALTKKAAIVIPARPYFFPAMEEFEKTELEQIANRVMIQVQIAFNL